MKKNKVKLGLSLLIVLSTPIAVNAVASSEAHAEKSTISTGGYVNEVYYVDGKPANWWYDDGKDWFFSKMVRNLQEMEKIMQGLITL